ncbi:MAG: DNA primase [Gammaproteobacteria bacterium]
MAGRIPESFIDELMNRVDVVEVIDARVPLKKAGKEYKACCPFHNEKTPSFTVSQSKQFYHCFGCGAHGTAVGFLMEYEHMSFPEAIEELARMVGMEVPREAVSPQQAKRRSENEGLYQILEKSDQYFQAQLRQHPQAKQAVDYLKGRGLSGEIAKEYGIGFAPKGWDNLMKALATSDETKQQLLKTGMLIQKDNGDMYDRFRGRIMFPIRDRRGRTIAFGGRTISSDDGAKYLNSPETPLFHKGRELYGLYEARQALRDIPRLMVVEGYMDVISLAQFGIRYAVATLGTATTEDHLNRLFRICPEVVFCFDGDRAGRDAAWRALENALPIMREGRQIRFLFLPEGEDPDTLVRKQGKEQFEALVGQAQAFSDFFFQNMQKDLELRTPEGRGMLYKKTLPYLAQLAPGIYRRLMIDQLAKLTQYDAGTIDQDIEKEDKKSTSKQAAPLPSSRPRVKATGKQPKSLVRTALGLLLRQPTLAQKAGEPSRLKNVDKPGVPLLMDVLEILQANPQLNSAGLLLRYQATGHEPHLQKLMSQQILLEDDNSMEPEFLSALDALEQSQHEDRLDSLSLKGSPSQLSDEEKAELRKLTTRPAEK